MRAKRFLQPCVLLLLAGAMTAASGQSRPCSAVAPNEREAARATGVCTDDAPAGQSSPKQVELPPVVVPIPNVIGLSFDDARDRLPGFSLRRTYRASAEPGGTVLEQQPLPPARVAAGAVIRVVLSDGTLRPVPRVPEAEVDQPPAPAIATRAVVAESAVAPGSVAPTEPSSTREARPDGTQRGAEPVAARRTRAPQVVGLPIAQARSRLAEFRIERIDRPSDAPIGEVIAQSPKSAESIARRQPITLIVSSGPANSANKIEQVTTRDASRAPAASSDPPKIERPDETNSTKARVESQVERVDVPNAAAQAEVLTPDLPAGAPVVSVTTSPPQASDGLLVTAPVTAPVVAPEPPPAPALAPGRTPSQTPVANTFAGNAALILGSGILVGVLLGALLARRWFLKRGPTIDAVAEPVGIAHVDAAATSAPVTGAPSGTRFVARLDEGETTIEFAAPEDLEADLDAGEITFEEQGNVHA